MSELVCPFTTYGEMCIPTEGVVACEKCANNPKNKEDSG